MLRKINAGAAWRGLAICLSLLLALAPALANAQTPPSKAPDWFKEVPSYENAQKFDLDTSVLALLGVNPSQFYIVAYLSPDPVATIANFYSTKLSGNGWQKDSQQLPIAPDNAQLLTFERNQNNAEQGLGVLIASKEGLESFSLTASIGSKVPAGQKLIVLFAQLAVTPAVTNPNAPVTCKPGVECQAGAYTIKVSFDRSSFNTVDQFTTTVERLDQKSADWQVKAEVVPQRGTSATLVQFKGDFENGTAAKRAIKMDLPISGNWNVTLTLNGSAGKAIVQIPVRAEPPPQLDEGIAWLIGLLPLIGFVGFGIGQWRMVVRRRRADQAATIALSEAAAEPLTTATAGVKGED